MTQENMGINRRTVSQQYWLLILIAAALFVTSIAGCSDYFEQKRMDAMLTSWIGEAQFESYEMVDEVASTARVTKSSITADSPLHRAISRERVVNVDGHAFLLAADKKNCTYHREDGQMTVLVLGTDNDAEDSLSVIVSQ